MTVVVTGAAGFIGYHVAEKLLAQGRTVIGVDDLNSYYDTALKEARLDGLRGRPNFQFVKADISDRRTMTALFGAHPEITDVVHLAAQAGVRHSLKDPFVYVQSNVMGHLVMLEAARTLPKLDHFVYASSSSVYGANTKLPFAESDRVDNPQSLYAATKRADELISHTYTHLYRIPATGLRFFTVYGPWGRPDMAPFIFTRAILEDRPIPLFNKGELWRDFTYIDDIVSGVLSALERPPAGDFPHRIYNLGNNNSEKVTEFIAALETALGKKAAIELAPMQPGDVVTTHADIEDSQRDLGFKPTTPMKIGVQKFVDWYRAFYKV